MKNIISTSQSHNLENARVTELEEEVRTLEAEVTYLRNLVNTQADTINQLQYRADPYSEDGTPICNSFF